MDQHFKRDCIKSSDKISYKLKEKDVPVFLSYDFSIQLEGTSDENLLKSPVLDKLPHWKIKYGAVEYKIVDFNKTTPMFWAIVHTSSASLVQKLILSGYNINLFVEQVNGMPALMLAVLENNMDIIEILLQRSADTHARDFNYGTALDVAIDKSLLSVVKILLTHGEDINCKHHIMSPLLRMIKMCDITMVEYVIDLGGNIKDGWIMGNFVPPLNMAVDNCFFDIAMLLLEKGADVKAEDYVGDTALHKLARKLEVGNQHITYIKLELARVLINKGADVNAKNSRLETPLFGAVNSSNPELVQLLLNAGADFYFSTAQFQYSILIQAIDPTYLCLDDLNSTPTKKHMVDLGKTVSTFDKEEFFQRQCEVVELLIKRGIDVNIYFNGKPSPIQVAVMGPNFKIVKLLVEEGADINGQLKNAYGVTPLHLCVETNNLKTAKYLVENGANVNIKPISPLVIAVHKGYYEMTKFLIDQGADVNATDKNGATPLHYATKQSLFHIAKLLIGRGANVNSKNIKGFTPFDVGIVEEVFNCDFVLLFLQHGLRVKGSDEFGIPKDLYVLRKINPEMIKAFWYYGYPYDQTDFKNEESDLQSEMRKFYSFNSSAASTGGDEAAQKKIINVISAQNEFLVGLETNDANLVITSINNGAEPRGCSTKVKFPIHYLVEKRYHEVLEILLNKNVPVNIVDNNQLTPLKVAARNSDVTGCRCLLQHGACYVTTFSEQNQEISELFSTIDKAFKSVRRRDGKALKMLQKYVDDQDWDLYRTVVNCVNKKGHTLMASAVFSGERDTAERLMRLRIVAPDW
ncbi:hypothetical protein J6590_003911 [Homalodisca vitripennis]|nr:hypothetical protein J6590_003911 [Homalodisca vitripennis]